MVIVILPVNFFLKQLLRENESNDRTKVRIFPPSQGPRQSLCGLRLRAFTYDWKPALLRNEQKGFQDGPPARG